MGRQGLSMPPRYTTWDRSAAGASVARLARVGPTVLAGGHGQPLTGPGTAELVRAFAARLPGVPEGRAPLAGATPELGEESSGHAGDGGHEKGDR
jgi:hypothetical protein